MKALSVDNAKNLKALVAAAFTEAEMNGYLAESKKDLVTRRKENSSQIAALAQLDDLAQTISELLRASQEKKAAESPATSESDE